jgi:hypothetical protein
MVEFVPVNAFVAVSGIGTVDLPDGFVLRQLSDQQISAAIGCYAVPAEFAGGPNTVTVSRLHQWALTRQRSYPVCSSAEVPAQPIAPRFEPLTDSATRLITALRLVCGGSAIATRALHAGP